MHNEDTTESHGLTNLIKKIQSMALDSIANETQLQETIGELRNDLRDLKIELGDANKKIESLTSERDKLADLLQEWVDLANRLKT